MELYLKTAFKTSKLVTRNYSTSFSTATRLFDKEICWAIYSIYGFVRFADEIVDTFHGFDKHYLIEKFQNDYYDALNQGISLNPILHSFQCTVKKYNIPDEHIQAFLKSMKEDLNVTDYNSKSEISEYIYGSADVVGLMCLKVFCDGDEKMYKELEIPAMKLGSAFQKVNFLRDLKSDLQTLNRKYFPQVKRSGFEETDKQLIINDIETDFTEAFKGIKKLPNRSKLAVLIAYYYYKILLRKIKNTPASKVIETRIRVSNSKKLLLLLKAMFVYKLKLV